MQRQLLGPVALGVRVPEGVAREYANLLLERRRGHVGVVPAELMRAGINADRRRGRHLLPAQPRPLHHPRAARDPLRDDRPRAGRRRGPRDRRGDRRLSTGRMPPPTARARPATCRAIVLPDQAAAQRVRPAGPRRHQLRRRRARRPASPPPTSPVANQSRAQFAGTTGAGGRERRLRRRAGRRRRPGPQPRSASMSSASSGSTQTPARPLEAVRAARSSSAIEQRKRAEALEHLVDRVEEQDRRRRERRGGGARRAPDPRHHAADHRGRPGAAARHSSLPPELQPLLRSAFEIDPDDPEPVVEQIAAQRALRPGRRRARRFPRRRRRSPRSATGSRRAHPAARARAGARRSAEQIVAPDQWRHAGGAGLRPGRSRACPRREPVDMQRLEISRGGQQVPPPLITLVQPAAGPRASCSRRRTVPAGSSSITSSARRATPRASRS